LSSKWSLPIRFSNQTIVCISHLSHPCYMPCPPHPPWFDHNNNVWWNISSSLCSLLYSAATFSLLGPNILSTLFSNTLNICSSLSVRGLEGITC
jgi:hypothetical protein